MLTQRHRLVFSYLAMVSLNAYALVRYQQEATDGYALSYAQPIGYTFSVWGIIYSLQGLLVLFALPYPNVADALVASFFLNGLWLVANGLAVVEHLSYWLAVFILIAYLGTLIAAYLWQGVDYAKSTSFERLVLYAPISANTAWVVLAALLNLTNTLMDDRLDFSKHENLTRVGGPDFAVGLLGFASLLALSLAWVRSDLVYAGVTVWALIGVAAHQIPGSGFPHPVSTTLHDFAASAAAGVTVLSVAGAAWRHCASENVAKSV